MKENLLLGKTEHSDTTTNDSREAARVWNILTYVDVEIKKHYYYYYYHFY